MTAVLVGLVLGVVASLIAGEITEVSPWLAHKLVRWAARRWSTNADEVAAYAEEWQRVIEDRPGKLLKLGTAVGFIGGALLRTIVRMPQRWNRRRRLAYWVGYAVGYLGDSFTGRQLEAMAERVGWAVRRALDKSPAAPCEQDPTDTTKP